MENLLAAIFEALAQPTVSYIGLGYDNSISINAGWEEGRGERERGKEEKRGAGGGRRGGEGERGGGRKGVWCYGHVTSVTCNPIETCKFWD